LLPTNSDYFTESLKTEIVSILFPTFKTTTQNGFLHKFNQSAFVKPEKGYKERFAVLWIRESGVKDFK